MNLIEKYSYCFTEDVREKGESIFGESKVQFYESSPSHIRAEVDADEFCDVHLEVKDGLLRMTCECRESQNHVPCEHIWASLVAANKFGDLTKAAKRSVKKIPVFADGKAPATIQKEGKPEIKVEPKTSSKPKSKSKKEDFSDFGNIKLKDSEAKNVYSFPTPDSENFSQSFQPEIIIQERPNYEILYSIEIPSTRGEDQLSLRTYWKQKRNNGEWSDYRPLEYIPGDTYPSLEDDEIMFSLRRAHFMPKLNNYGDSARTPSNYFKLDKKLASQILPKIAKVGRLACVQSGDLSKLNYSHFNNEEWEFRPLFQQTGENRYEISGVLGNASETINLSEILFLADNGVFLTMNQVGKLNAFKAEDLIVSLHSFGVLRFHQWEFKVFVKDLLEKSELDIDNLPLDIALSPKDIELKGTLFIRTAKYKYRGTEQLHADLSFNYGGSIVKEEDESKIRIVDFEKRELYQRTPDREAELKDFLYSLEFRYNTNPAQEELGWKLLPRKLDDTVRILTDMNWEVVAEGKTYRKPQEKNASLSFNMDWLELKGGVKFGDQEVPLPTLMAEFKAGNNYVKLDDGSMGVLPLEWLKNYTVLTEIGIEKDDLIKFKRSQILLLDAYLAEKNHCISNFDFEAMKSNFANFAGVKPREAPETFQGELREYQKFGLGWMNFLQNNNLGACLADDMGLGKTVQALALLEERRMKNIKKPSLIVVPKSLLFNWFDEAERFTPKIKVLINTGPDRDKTGKSFSEFNLVLTTYGTLKRDIHYLKDIEFDYCVLDESQAIKNSGTEAAKAVRALNADYRLTMTGTPIENHIGELLSQFDFLNPGMFGNAARLKKIATNANVMSKEDLNALKKALKPLVLRRKKEEVAKDLPPKTEQVIFCEMDDWQMDKYDELKEFYQYSLSEESGNKQSGSVDILGALLRLRQAACHPGLINDKFLSSPSAKLETLMEMLKELIEEKHKILIFSQFTSFLGIVKNRLDLDGHKYCYLDGATKDRANVVKQFQNQPEINAFLISLKAGGVGLNLTAADYVFLLDPWWNPAVEAQAIDRAYRIGQDKHVIAYRLIAKNTVEEKVLLMQKKKRALSDLLIKANTDEIQGLSRKDLMALF